MSGNGALYRCIQRQQPRRTFHHLGRLSSQVRRRRPRAETNNVPRLCRLSTEKITRKVLRKVTTTASTTDATQESIDDDQKRNNLVPKKRRISKGVAYLDLAKAKLSALVVSTTAAGFIAAGGPISTQLDVLTACLVGTALCSSSAAAINQIVEIDRDRKMKRTQQRPMVKGTLTMTEAITATSLWGIGGTAILALGTDPVTTALGAGNIALYGGLYTWMKRVSIYNTWVGAVVGAIPPVMGWSAATGGSLLDTPALILGSALYFWQMPHFFALSYMHRIDYQRGGFQMLPCVENDPTHPETAGVIVRYAWYLSAIPFISTITNVTSSMFALEGIALNAYALTVAHRFQRERTNANARKVFLTSLWYLPSLLMLFLLHSKVWDEEKDEDDMIAKLLSKQINKIRDIGREMCIHEVAVVKAPKGEEACPVQMTSKESRKQVERATEVMAATAENVSLSVQDTSKNSS